MIDILQGDCIEVMGEMPDQTFHTCITSPPYWGLRDYGVDNQLGLEETPEEYVEKMVAVFREVKRVLRDDGTLWLNLGDSYASSPAGNFGSGTAPFDGGAFRAQKPKMDYPAYIKQKDLVGIPWLVAFALRADGWYLRSDIIWHKPNPMPESVTDRPTKAHEYLFLLSKKAKYYYDADAVKEPYNSANPNSPSYRKNGKSDSRKKHAIYCRSCNGSGDEIDENGEDCRVCGGSGLADIGKSKTAVKNDGVWKPDGIGRNLRSVWTVTTAPFKEAHFATFPPKLIEPCIKAGAPVGGKVLDPFGGAGTTGLVADRLGRDAILIELNEEYCEIARKRIYDDAPLLAGV